MSVFITGSGTDVGKTYVSCGLLQALHRRGQSVRPLKPVLSGVDDDTLTSSDAGHLLAAAGRSVDDVDNTSPWRFSAPLSPDAAAAREGRAVPFDDVVAFCRRALDVGPCLVEGVGGVLVPLDDTHTVRDWMQALQLPAVVVTHAALGTLSHTLCAVEAVRHVDLRVAAVVVNAATPLATDGPPLDETVATLRRFLPDDTKLFALAHDAVEPSQETFDALASLLFPPPTSTTT